MSTKCLSVKLFQIKSFGAKNLSSLKKEHWLAAANLAMDKLQQAGLNLGQVFNFRHGRALTP